MKIGLTYLLFFSLCMLGCYWAVNSNYNPERLILGEWGEMAWTYDKVDAKDTHLNKYASITEDVRINSGRHLFIHESEKWRFEPDGDLLLQSKGKVTRMQWKITGRGHILQLIHEDSEVENYNILEITKYRLVLNFEIDLEVRGIARLAFSKFTRHAQ